MLFYAVLSMKLSQNHVFMTCFSNLNSLQVIPNTFGAFLNFRQHVMKTVTNVISRLLDDFDTPNLAGTSDRPKLENINHQATKHLKNFGFMILF